jgi:hypothetical protein
VLFNVSVRLGPRLMRKVAIRWNLATLFMAG